jgi:glyoxylase-like metal-dependent hydrolase (beta-lactamase superfamily II)
VEIKRDNFMISTEFWGRNLNLFLVQGEHLFLIDTGLAGMPGELVFPYMDDHGLSLETLTLFANTHAHADHIGGKAEIKAVPGALSTPFRDGSIWFRGREADAGGVRVQFPCRCGMARWGDHRPRWSLYRGDPRSRAYTGQPGFS